MLAFLAVLGIHKRVSLPCHAVTAPTCALLTALAYLASTPRELVIFLTGFHAFLLAATSFSYDEIIIRIEYVLLGHVSEFVCAVTHPSCRCEVQSPIPSVDRHHVAVLDQRDRPSSRRFGRDVADHDAVTRAAEPSVRHQGHVCIVSHVGR